MYFCSSEFWNSNLTWYTDSPQLTTCFQSTVLVYIPAAVFLLFSCLDIFNCVKSKVRTIPWSPSLIVKLILTASAAIISTVELVSVIFSSTVFLADLIDPIIKIFVFLCSIVLLLVSKHYGQVYSPAQFFFWMSVCICQTLIIVSFSNGEVSIDTPNNTTIILDIFYLIVGSIMFFLNWFADKQPLYADLLEQVDDNPSPKKFASLPSRLLFAWFDQLILQGWKNPLTQKDLWSLNPEDTLQEIVPALESRLYKDKEKPVHVLSTLFKTYWHQFVLLTLFYFLKTALQLANPQIINLMIDYVEMGQEQWKGLLYMAMFGGVFLLTILFDTLYWTTVLLLTVRVYSGLASIIYKKSLKLAAISRSKYSSGEILNLIAVDASKVQEALTYVCFLWMSPVHVGMTVYFTWQIIGPAVLVGLGVLIILVPMNGIDFYYMEKFQMRQMDHKDMRVKLISEILNGIKVLKMYSWEKPFIKKIEEIRAVELHSLKWVQYLDSVLFLVWNSAPFLVAVGSFVTFIYLDPENNILDAKTAFVSLSLFNTLQAPFFLLPYSIQTIVQATVSIKRINKFLNSAELDPDNTSSNQLNTSIVAKNAYFTWGGKTDPPVLKNLNFIIKKGSLTAVVGRVGSGKSSLLSALLGEMQKTNGFVNIDNSIAYVSQNAWIRNMSLKKNILFDKELNVNFYNKVLYYCALEDDLKQLAGGDQTEIGEKGINLSGGQKQRVNLARAVYANKDIYLLDDPLSAVDSHVGKHIFEKVIGEKGVLAKKTRILVTHAISYLPQVDNIIVMKDGAISEIGSYNQLLNNKGEFADFLLEQLQNSIDKSDSENENDNDAIWKSLENTLGSDEVIIKRQHSKENTKPKKVKVRTSSIGELSDCESTFSDKSVTSYSNAIDALNDKSKLIEIEAVETQEVSIKNYVYYFKSMGYWIFALGFVSYAIFQAFAVSTNLVLTSWSSVASNDTAVTNQYMILYGVLGGSQSLFIFFASVVMTIGMVRASKSLHSTLLENILKAPMSFFDTTPLGRIVNRFSKDTDEIDTVITFVLKDLLNQLFILLGIMFVLTYVSPITLSLIVPMIIYFVIVRALYLKSARQIKRMMATNRSPINSHLEETISGANTIRAFRFQERFIEENNDKVEILTKSLYTDVIANNWLVWRLHMIGAVLIVLVTLIIVLNPENYSSGDVGLILSYILTCQMSIYWMTRMSADLEKAIVSVERVKEYQEVDKETDVTVPYQQDSTTALADWPARGDISFDNYSTRYRAGLDLVLKDVTCHFNAGHKIGIVGRTGAGKSSITLSLFRIIEASSGSIFIDNVNIASIPLEKLRSAITIIPQDPVLFSGSLRSNLDPFGQHSDNDLWRVLRLSHLTDLVHALADGLDHEVVEGGSNLSVGQRQLVCLARAILRKTKILVLDEATAAVDLETDDLIQATIREEFSDCTVLTIAHRIKTILDSDRVMVMDNGAVVEYERPSSLLGNPDSHFYKMSLDAGLINTGK